MLRPWLDCCAPIEASLPPGSPSGNRRTSPRSARVLGHDLSRHEDGVVVPWVIQEDENIVGRVTISDIVRGPFQNGHLGYWVAHECNSRGVAIGAVSAVVRIAFDDLGLHRLQAATLVHNIGSRRVLARNGYSRIGLAPRYLQIAGRWQDHLLLQRLNEDPD